VSDRGTSASLTPPPTFDLQLPPEHLPPDAGERKPEAWKSKHRRRLAPLALAVLLASCGSLTQPDPSSSALSLEQPLPTVVGKTALRAGNIRFYGDPLIVDVPASATAGVPFTVSVTTYGGGCIAEAETVVQVNGWRAHVVPYQRVSIGLCTQELRITKREASVTFAVPGQAVVRVIGRKQPEDELIEVERIVVVR